MSERYYVMRIIYGRLGPITMLCLSCDHQKPAVCFPMYYTAPEEKNRLQIFA